ncbi:hypothetical protein BY458DRAFT_178309 [Sporodiniella umbellata]|nr:hypothetical protein BY458DRAFT_178309 [Sporodiniella umbellata]
MESHTANSINKNQPMAMDNSVSSLKRAASEENTSSPSSIIDCVKRMKIQPQLKAADFKSGEQLQLFNTCKSLWPRNQTLGDFSHDRIVELSNMIKVRLLQGKFKLMDSMDQDNELYSLFSQDRTAPTKIKEPQKITLSGKRTKSVLSVVGNRRNLPTLPQMQNRKQQKEYTSPLFFHDYDALLSPLRQHPTKKEKKTPKPTKNSRTPIKSPRTPMKSPRVAAKSPKTPAKTPNTPRRKGTTPDAPIIVLPDGKRFFLCEPCGKRYKNRNGLTYHLERCKNNGPFNREEDELQSQQSINTPMNEHTPMNEGTPLHDNTPTNEGTPTHEHTPNTHISHTNTPLGDYTPVNEIMLNQATPTTFPFEENKDEPMLEEFDLFDSINSSFDDDVLSSLQGSNLGFSPQVDDLYNLF